MRLVLAALLLAGCANEPKSSGAAAVPAAETTTAAAASQSNVQTVDIKVSGGEYIPASVNVTNGQRVRLNFTRDAKPTCGDVVVFPDHNIRKEIPVNQVVSVDLTPAQSGNVKFTCGMNMMQGTIVVN